MSRIKYDTIPEDLVVKELMVTQGRLQKKMRIMGRGRTGIGYMRWANVQLKVAKINFEDRIAAADTWNQKQKWVSRRSTANQMRTSRPTYLANEKEMTSTTSE